jgi:hypothetical protein
MTSSRSLNERAVVEDAGQAALSRWDERVEHHELALEVQ